MIVKYCMYCISWIFLKITGVISVDGLSWRIYNDAGINRVVVTKELPGTQWLEILKQAGCRVEICTSTSIIGVDEIKASIGARCEGAIGQLTENWNEGVFLTLKKAGCVAYSNYAVGYNNVDVEAATGHGIPVGNTPGVLTETTAEMAVALTMAAARRVVEADAFMRSGGFKGWLPTLFLGRLLKGKTVGVIGVGRIGSAYARMMVEGFKMNLIYYDILPNEELERHVESYNAFLKASGMEPLTCTYAGTVEEVLEKADVVSLHPVLDASTRHMINAERLRLMKKDSLLINASRGPVIEETALVAHLEQNPDFRAGLDVYEDEPEMAPGLSGLDNSVLVPHIASATGWTRRGMAVLAASNVAAILRGFPVWQDPENIEPFLGDSPPQAAPSIVNAAALDLPLYKG
jgi:hydroxypyruvate reductase 1